MSVNKKLFFFPSQKPFFLTFQKPPETILLNKILDPSTGRYGVSSDLNILFRSYDPPHSLPPPSMAAIPPVGRRLLGNPQSRLPRRGGSGKAFCEAGL
jgi:hypothetical protein